MWGKETQGLWVTKIKGTGTSKRGREQETKVSLLSPTSCTGRDPFRKKRVNHGKYHRGSQTQRSKLSLGVAYVTAASGAGDGAEGRHPTALY